MNKLQWTLGLGLVVAVSDASAAQAAPQQTTPQNVRSIQNMRTVYVQRIQGDRVFGRRLINEMRGLGLRFVRDKSRADALLSARGDYSRGQFFGTVAFRDKSGRVIWSAQALR